MRWKKIIKIAFLLACSQILFGQPNENQCSFKTGSYNYSFTVPNGWVSDYTVKGLSSVFYPKNSTWFKSPTVMYVNIISVEEKDQGNIFSMIDYDIENYYINTPGMKISYGNKINFNNGDYLSVVVYLYGASDGATLGNSLAIAYIPQLKEMINIVMSSESRAEFEANLPAFESLVKSYDVVQSKYAASAR